MGTSSERGAIGPNVDYLPKILALKSSYVDQVANDQSSLHLCAAAAGSDGRQDNFIIFAAQYASGVAWIGSGLRVSCLLGHSFCQLTALCVSGSLPLHDAIELVVGRAELIDSKWEEVKKSMVSVQSVLGAVRSLLDFQTPNTSSKLPASTTQQITWLKETPRP